MQPLTMSAMGSQARCQTEAKINCFAAFFQRFRGFLKLASSTYSFLARTCVGLIEASYPTRGGLALESGKARLLIVSKRDF